MYNSEALSTFTVLCDCHLLVVREHSHHHQSLAITNLLSVSLDLPFLDISYTGIVQYEVFPDGLFFFLLSIMFSSSPRLQQWISPPLPFHGWLIFHHGDKRHFTLFSNLAVKPGEARWSQTLVTGRRYYEVCGGQSQDWCPGEQRAVFHLADSAHQVTVALKTSSVETEKQLFRRRGRRPKDAKGNPP